MKLKQLFKITPQKLIAAVAIAMSLFHVYTATFGILLSFKQRAIHIGFALVLCFLITGNDRVKNQGKDGIPLLEILLALLGVITFGYITYNGASIVERYSYVTPLSPEAMIIGSILILLLIETCRRTIGMIFVLILCGALAYGFFGSHLPEIISHRGFSFMWTIDHLIYTNSGIFGTAAGVSSTYIFIFILFGAFLEKTGAGDKMINLAFSLVGKQRGGPAKAGVIASGLFGMISGTAVGNVCTTGNFTIPMMKKLGYKPTFAAAVEACASSGGQIMPPLMGATAFLIAEFTGIAYIEVAKAAAIPAFLYFTAIFIQVHLRAKRRNICGLEENELPAKWHTFVDSFPYLFSLVAIVVLLIVGYTPLKAGLYAIIIVILINVVKSFLAKVPAITFKEIIHALESAPRSVLPVALVCSASGIVTGIISMTGIGLRISSIILDLSGGYLFTTLLIVMITSLILGMGLPTSGAYIIQVALTVPALIQMGVAPIAAHLFIFYYGALWAITPPVALAAFAAAGIAKSPPMETGFVAFKLAIAGFIIPFMFVYSSSIALVGTPGEIIFSSLTALVGIIALSIGVEGWFLLEVSIVERVLAVIGGVLLIFPNLTLDLIGLTMLIIIIIYQFIGLKNKKKTILEHHTTEQFNS